MEKDYEQKYHEVEDGHWWFVGRREIIKKIVNKFPKKSKILDIGCSGGIIMQDLKKIGFSSVYGIDISKKAIELCKLKGISNTYLMDAAKLSFNNKFDVMIASDILEHTDNDNLTVKNWNINLAKDGIVLCFVPAFPFLWSEHDASNKHFRRYTKKQLENVFRQNGFEIVRTSYWNFLLFLPISVIKLFSKIFKSDKKTLSQQIHLSNNSFINYFLVRLLRLENWML